MSEPTLDMPGDHFTILRGKLYFRGRHINHTEKVSFRAFTDFDGTVRPSIYFETTDIAPENVHLFMAALNGEPAQGPMHFEPYVVIGFGYPWACDEVRLHAVEWDLKTSEWQKLCFEAVVLRPLKVDDPIRPVPLP